jgi:hypothetical protein
VATLVVPELDLSYPTLGPALADFIEERFVFGPGSLAGRPARLDAEKRAVLYRLYEVYPQGHRLAGRRRFQRGAIEWRKGKAKTELAAWIGGLELHPESPVRCDGFDAAGNPVGRPVAFPYVAFVALGKEQVSELAYGVLKYIIENCPDSHLFDSSLERIMRIGRLGEDAGRAVPLATAPNARDGALTTWQHFDEPHRLTLASQKETHETMDANLGKRPLEDPWALYTSTPGKPGQESVQEDIRYEAELMAEGKIEEDTGLLFMARWAGPEHKDLSTVDALIAAIADATGPSGEYGPGQFESIAKKWFRPKADKAYLERVYLARWRKSGSMAFDALRIDQLVLGQEIAPPLIPEGAFCTLGFDGARFRDSTGFVLTDIATGRQQLVGGWERPADLAEDAEWEIDELEVTETLAEILAKWDVWKLYGDPPHWTETMGSWSVKWPDQIEEWWTQRYTRMAYTLREYVEAQDSGTVTYGGTPDQQGDLIRHLKQAGRKDLRLLDDDGQPLWIMQKQPGRRDLKFDFAMAAVLSWKARLDAIKTGAKPRRRTRRAPRRLR